MREELVEQTEQCALIQDLLPLYLDNEVSHESHSAIANHLASCERCAGFLAGTRAMYDVVRREQHTRADIIARDQDQHTIMAGRRLAIIAIAIVVTIAILALTVLLIFLSPMFFTPPGI